MSGFFKGRRRRIPFPRFSLTADCRRNIPAGIDDIHFDSKRNRLYASCCDSALLVIEKVDEEYKIVAKLETPKDSRTCVLSKGKLYLGVPKQEGQVGPSVRIYEAHPVIQDAQARPVQRTESTLANPDVRLRYE